MTRLVVVAALACVVCGCSATPSAGPATSGAQSAPGSATAQSGAPASASSAAVAWADKLCAAIAPALTTMSKQPEIDQNDPAKAKDALVAYFGQAADAVRVMAAGVQSAGDPPVAGAADTAKALQTVLATARTTYVGAHDKLAAANVTDLATLQQVMSQIQDDMTKMQGQDDPTKVLENNAELEAAIKAAPACKAFSS